MVALFLFIIVILGSFSVVFAAEDDLEIHGNTVSIISQSEDGAYRIRSTLKNIKTSDGGKWVYTAELLKAEDPSVNRIQIQILRETSAKSDFKFSSSSKAQGLFESTGSYSKDEILAMVTEGSAKVKHDSFVSLSASYINFDTGDPARYNGALELDTSYPQTLFSCEFAINPNYDSGYKDWREGFENALTITTVMFKGTAQKDIFTSSVFSVPPAGEDSPSGGSNGLTIENNFTAPDTSYFDDAGITVTPSNNDLSFTVACNKACVVAIVNSDDTYTRLTGTAEDNAYKFTANSADDQIVVMVKGDANGDGEIGIADATQIKAAQLGKLTTLTALQVLVSDLNGDGEIGIADATQVKAAQLGKLNIAW